MNKQSRGLGRGLEALIPTMSEQEVVKELLISDIVATFWMATQTHASGSQGIVLKIFFQKVF